MDRNAFLAFALSFLVLSLWMTWEAQNRPKPVPQPGSEMAGEAVPGAPPDAAPPMPTEVAASAPAAPAAPGPTEAVAAPPAEELAFENPQVRAVLTSAAPASSAGSCWNT